MHALVEARHVDDDALVRALADRLALIADRNAEADGATLDARDLRGRRHREPYRRRREMAYVQAYAETLISGRASRARRALWWRRSTPRRA